LEKFEVELLGLNHHHVRRPGSDHHARSLVTPAAQARARCAAARSGLQDVLRRHGRLLTPDHIDEPISRNHPFGLN